MSDTGLWFTTLALSSCLATTAAIGADNECFGCHDNPAFYAEYPKLYDYFQQWLESPHQQAGVTCDDCHGGNADVGSIDAAHAGVLPMNDANSTLHFQKQPDTCGQCHRAKRNQFLRSEHFEALMGQRAAPTCTTCHPAMSRRPELRTIVVTACRNCHGEDNNLPLIADQAEYVFQQLNIAGGLLGWTRIHYESQDWPDETMGRVMDLENRYETIIDRVHQFNLDETEVSVGTLLGDLRRMFEAARLAHDQRNDDETE